jgi:CubicO group peptidase (beta-lactamase class C family)
VSEPAVHTGGAYARPSPRTTARAGRCLAALAVLAVLGCSDGPSGAPPPGAVELAEPWTSVEPQEVGLDPLVLHLADLRAREIERMRSLLVVRQGRLAFERYYGGSGADTLADLRSVTKSVVAMLVGMALADGDIARLDQPMTDFLGDEHAVRPEHALITIRHLLTMTSGFAWNELEATAYDDWILSGDHVDYLLDRPLSDPPGTAFAYNSAAVHLLGVILEEATGASLPTYADRELFGPLGIGTSAWEELPDGYNGGSGLDLRPRDAARLGQLMLQNGWSGARSLVPEPWLRASVADGWSVPGSVGPVEELEYGYLWWRDPERGAFFAWGFGGQFVYVAPLIDLVVVATTEWRGVRDDIGDVRLREEVMKLIVESVLRAAP